MKKKHQVERLLQGFESTFFTVLYYTMKALY